MTEKEKQQRGMLYDANHDPEVLEELHRCEQACFEINQIPPNQRDERKRRIRQLLGKVGEDFTVVTPFFCDYGYNIKCGENFFCNAYCVILDEAEVTFGDNVFIAPSCSFYTAGHPLDVEQRNKGLEYAYPIHVGNNVWIGGNTTVLPGVTIGNNVTIGAGSVVTHDIPDNVIAAGNPCRVLKPTPIPPPVREGVENSDKR